MDPITIALMGGSMLSNLFTRDQASKSADAALRFQQQRAAEQDRFARAGRTDAFGNRVSYDQALNEWITQLTPEQKALMMAQEREQRLSLTEDARRNREARMRLARAGEMAVPAFDEAMAGMRFRRPRSEEALRGELAQLIAMARAPGGPDFSAIRGAETTPTFRGIEGGGIGDFAKTLLQARSQGLTESAARGAKHMSEYGPAIDRYLQMMGMGGGAPLASPSTAESTNATQNAMAQLMAQVGAQGSAAIGGAQKLGFEAAKMPIVSGSDLSRLLAAQNRGVGKTSRTSGTNATSELLAPESSDPYWLETYRTQTNPNFYF